LFSFSKRSPFKFFFSKYANVQRIFWKKSQINHQMAPQKKSRIVEDSSHHGHEDEKDDNEDDNEDELEEEELDSNQSWKATAINEKVKGANWRITSGRGSMFFASRDLTKLE
jgi:hypothetical protein